MKLISAYHGTDSVPFKKFKSTSRPVWFATDFATAATYGENVAEVNILVDSESTIRINKSDFQIPDDLCRIVMPVKKEVLKTLWVETLNGRRFKLGTAFNGGEVRWEKWFKDFVRQNHNKKYGFEENSPENLLNSTCVSGHYFWLACKSLNWDRFLGKLKTKDTPYSRYCTFHQTERVFTELSPTYKTAIVNRSVTKLYKNPLSEMKGYSYDRDLLTDVRINFYERLAVDCDTIATVDVKNISSPIWHKATDCLPATEIEYLCDEYYY